MEKKSLFERLGGSDGISKIVDTVAGMHLENPVIQARFRPLLDSAEKLATAKEHLARFFEMGAGGPQRYAGRSMPDAHRGMNISAAEYMAAMDDIGNALQKHGIDDQTRNDVLAIAWSLKGEIMHL